MRPDAERRPNNLRRPDDLRRPDPRRPRDLTRPVAVSRVLATAMGVVALAGSAVACANGDSIGAAATSGAGGGGDGGRDGAGGEVTGPGGGPASTGPGATTASGSSGTTSASTAASSSSGSSCSELPCKLVSPQCGCEAGEACSLDGSGDRVCTEDGPREPGQECGGALGACAAGSLCAYVFETEETLTSCSRFCETDAQCDGQGGVCALGLAGVEDVKLCSEACDLVSSSGCAIEGTKCSYGQEGAGGRYFNVCEGAGVGVAQELCGPGAACAPGFECFQTQEAGEVFRCFEWCSTAAPGCPGDLTCLTSIFAPPLTIGSVTYGVCAST